MRLVMKGLLATGLLGLAPSWVANADVQNGIEISSKESGTVFVRVLDEASRKTFPEGDAVLTFSGELKAGEVMRVNLAHLPNGQYAVAVFQDINGNGSLDANIVGMPTEPFGFSNNARGTFGPPDFSDVMFSVTGKNALQMPRIELRR